MSENGIENESSNHLDILEHQNHDVDVNHEDANLILNNIRMKNINNIIIAYLNVNTFSNKYDSLKTLIPGNIDVMIIGETKLDDSFPTSQFKIEGFAEPFRMNRDKNGWGLLIYDNDCIPYKQLKKHILPGDIEGMFIELNFRKTKWLLLGTYHPPNQNDEYYFQNIGNALDTYIRTYDKFILTVISTGISDFHVMILTVLKTTIVKAKPKQIFYRDYKNYDDRIFKDDLKRNLSADAENKRNFQQFQTTFLDVLEKHAPIKKRNIRANEVPYMTKTLRKAIMTRSRLQNRYHKLKTGESLQSFKRQRNFCNILYKRERKNYIRILI